MAISNTIATTGTSVTPNESVEQRDHRISPLWLMPASKSPERLTGTTVLDEELLALVHRGVDVHTLQHAANASDSASLSVHLIPSSWELGQAAKTVRIIRRQHSSLAARSWREKWSLAHLQSTIRSVVEGQRLSLIHSHWGRPAGTAGALGAELAKVPLVITLRGADVMTAPSIGYGQTLDRFTRRRLSHALSVADHVIAVSQAIADRAIKLGADPNRMTVIPKGVDSDRFTPGDTESARERLELPNIPTILFVGNLVPVKGVLDLVRAVPLVACRLPRFQLVLCGSGVQEEEITRLAESLEVTAFIQMAGYQDRERLPDYFRACDVFVLPSISEGSGNVLLEAAASGRPAIGTRVGGIPEYIADGETGFLVEPGDPGDLAAKLVDMLTDRDLALQLGAAGRKRAVEQFSYAQMVDSTLDVYQKVLA